MIDSDLFDDGEAVVYTECDPHRVAVRPDLLSVSHLEHDVFGPERVVEVKFAVVFKSHRILFDRACAVNILL